jgi:hypothetical protein
VNSHRPRRLAGILDQGRFNIAPKQTYQPLAFDGGIIMPDEIGRIYKEVLEFKHIEAISDPMRELIENLWPELVHKLPPKRQQGWPAIVDSGQSNPGRGT